MKLIFSFFLIFFLNNAFAQNKDVEQLKKLNEDWIRSYPTKDSATFNRIFANDIILISPNGTKFTKKEMISNLQKQDIISSHVESADVRLLTKDVGIVTAVAAFVAKDNGKEVKGKTCYQDVYIKRNGRWFAVSAHVTSLNAE